jgi:hypothetical protein
MKNLGGGLKLRLRAPRRLAAAATLVSLAVAVPLVVSGAASGSPLQTGTPGVRVIAQNGFGDHNNSYAWSMDWFNGKLYVGTGRDELCVENQTVQFFFPHNHTYTTNPSPGVHCPKNPYNMSLRAEIWQYTPAGAKLAADSTERAPKHRGGSPKHGAKHRGGSTQHTPKHRGNESTKRAPKGGLWKMVYRAPQLRNPLAPHKQVARDLAYRGMVNFRDPRNGKTALFAAGVSPDEYLPPLLKRHPPVLMRSFDGVHWQTLHMPSVAVHFPNGNQRAMGFRSLLPWRGHLFVTATPDITGDGALFEVTRPWSDHPGLRQVSGPQYDIFEIQTFHGDLYIGTGNKQVGYGVYRAWKYSAHAPLAFQKVVGNGAGRGIQVTSVVSMHVYRNRLYVGSSGWYNKGTIPVSEMIRIAPSGRWQVVVGNPRTLPDGKTLYPTSGLYDGFFSPFAAHFWRMDDQGGGLYVGTNDWAYTIQQDKSYAWLTETVLAGVLGFNLWATCDGNDWFAVTRDAFTGNEYNFGGRTLVTGGSHGQDLFVGTANQAQGTSIFDDRGEACGSLIGPNAVARPAALMTDTTRTGTLLSWNRSADATTYEVERAPFTNITLGLKPPATSREGWQFDDSVPTVTKLGAPGSVTTTLSLPGGFSPVATTDSADYVDHTDGHYVYEVIAKRADGATSQPSNIEAAPSGGPPATFKDLQSTLPATATTATAHRGLSGASRRQQLLDAAEAASDAGHYAVARGDLAKLQASAGDNDELATVAARVRRRLRYAGIAGAP